MVKILIADDHAIVRRGLKQIFAEQADLQVAGEAENAAQVLELVRRQPWDIVVLDLSMPGNSGLDVLKEIKNIRPEMPVLILSVHPEDQYALRALRAGAAGYMTKETAPEELVKAVRKIHAGGRYVSASMAETLAAGLAVESHRPPHENLSDREFQVFVLLASGKTAKETADFLAIGLKTVHTHRDRILKKMGLKSNVDLTQYAHRYKLIE